jgi:hypothetical protein
MGLPCLSCISLRGYTDMSGDIGDSGDTPANQRAFCVPIVLWATGDVGDNNELCPRCSQWSESVGDTKSPSKISSVPAVPSVPIEKSNPATKLCFVCGVVKLRRDFLPASLHADGLPPRCRRCILAAARRDCEAPEQRQFPATVAR